MTVSAPPIVAGVDGSGAALTAVAWAAQACTRHRLPLRLVHAYSLPTRGYPEVISSARELRAAMYDQGRLWLSAAVAVAESVAPGIEVEHDLRMEHAVPTLLAESFRARQVVLGSRGLGGFTGAIVGSTAVALTVYGGCPVVVVRGNGTKGPVVVGVDTSAGSDAAIGFAFDEAAASGVPLIAATSGTEAPKLGAWTEKHPDVPVEHVVSPQRPVPMLLELGETARMVVVGSRGRGGFAGMLLGSTSQALVYHSPCPVAVVRT